MTVPPDWPHEPRIRVLQSVRAIRSTTNPYVTMLIRTLSPTADVALFSWRAALFSRYDVLHVHWPELIFTRRSRVRTLLHSALLCLLLVRLSVVRVPIVRTMHNISPHESQSWLTNRLLRAMDRRTTLWIALNPQTVPPGDVEVDIIPHPHYRDWYADTTRARPVPGRIAFFGQVRDYKNVSMLIAAFRQLDDPAVSLAVVGGVADPALGALLAKLAAGDERVGLRFEHIPDDELALMVTESAVVALPYREMNNSGALFLALSLDRPVLVPDNAVTAEVAREVGEDWVIRYEGELTGAVLADALSRAEREGRPTTPDLSAREWTTIADAHLAAYRRAIAFISG